MNVAAWEGREAGEGPSSLLFILSPAINTLGKNRQRCQPSFKVRVCKNGILKWGEQGRNPSRGHWVPKKEGKSEVSGHGLRQDQETRGSLDPGQRPGSMCLLSPPTQGPHRGGSSVCPQRWSVPGWKMGQVYRFLFRCQQGACVRVPSELCMCPMEAHHTGLSCSHVAWFTRNVFKCCARPPEGRCGPCCHGACSLNGGDRHSMSEKLSKEVFRG